MGSYSRHRRKEQGTKHVTMVVQLHQLEVRDVVLECCEKTVCLIPEITDIVNSGQTQWKYKGRKLRVEHKNDISKLRKICHVS